MLMLENLKKRKELMNVLRKALNNENYLCHVFNESVLENFHPKLTQDLINCFENSSISLVGVSHGKIMSPLFALNSANNGVVATLNAYLSFEEKNKIENNKKIERELTMLAVAISIFYPQVEKVKIPMIINEFSNSECYLKRFSNNCELYINKK